MDLAIRVKDIKKKLGNLEILKGISFDVKKGDIFGYLGPNGAGKTTTIRILLGLFKADWGEIKILDQDIRLREIRNQIGFVLDKDGLYDQMTAEENIAYYGQIYGVTGMEKRITELLEIVRLGPRAKDMVGSYSKGMRQRLALARAMIHDPQILILDEPTSGLDPSGQIEIRELLKEMANDQNKTVFLSSHNLGEVQKICNRIALIDRGQIRLYGTLKDLRLGVEGPSVMVEIYPEVSESLIDEIKQLKSLGLEDIRDNNLYFSPEKGTEISDIISELVGRGIKIQQAVKKEASLEEMYSAILKEAEPS